MNAPHQNKTRLLFLDGLRGIAALLVVFFHFNNLLLDGSLHPFHPFLESILKQGHLGVEIFFVLSGFVICYSLYQKSISWSYLSTFALKRSLRLDPPFWTALALLIILRGISSWYSPQEHEFYDWKNIIVNAFYLSDFFNVDRILPVSWTLALELQFYLFFIVLLKLIQAFEGDQKSFNSPPTKLTIIFLMLFSLLQSTPWPIIPHTPGLFIYYWFSFFIGAISCWVFLKQLPTYFFWLNWFFILLLGIFFKNEALETCSIALFIYVILKKNGMNQIFTSVILQYLGKISYSLYLTHWILGVRIIDKLIRSFPFLFENSLMATSILLSCVGLSIGFAELFYRWVELPSLAWSQTLIFKTPSKNSTSDPYPVPR